MPLSLPGAFVDDVNVPLGAAVLNQVRDACILLDGLTAGRRHPVTPSTASKTTSLQTADSHPAGDYRHSWWGLRYRTGMTGLVVAGICDVRLDFYINGVFDSFQAASAGFAASIDISTGYADGDIILLEIRTNGNTSKTTYFLIKSVWAAPIDVASVWSGVPTFAGTYSAALLNQLIDAAQYLWDRVTACPIPPHVAYINATGTHKVESSRLFDGAVGRFQTSESLRIYGTLYAQNTEEHYEVVYDGVVEYTSPDYTVGQAVVIDVAIPLTHTIGTFADVAINSVVTDASNQAAPTTSSRFTLTALRSQATTAYATATPPSAFTAGESISVATLNSRLNALATLLDDAKTALDDAPELWGRAYAARRVPASDDHAIAKLGKIHCSMFQRQGNTLIVRGKGVKIGWGAITVKTPGENEAVNYTDFSFAHEASVGEQDKVTTSEIALDAIAGLEPGMTYYVYGATAIEFVGEYIS